MQYCYEATLLSVPRDIRVYLVNGFLDHCDALVIRCVCKEFRDIISQYLKDRAARLVGKAVFSFAGIYGLVKHGSVSLVQWLLPFITKPEHQSIIAKAAVRYGHLNILKAISSCVSMKTKDLMRLASLNGHLDCVLFLELAGCQISYSDVFNSARSNNAECCKYMYNVAKDRNLLSVFGTSCTLPNDCIAASIESENFDIFIWLWETAASNLTQHQVELIVSKAISRGHIDCLDYLYVQGVRIIESQKAAVLAAIVTNTFDCLKMLFEKFECQPHPDYCVSASCLAKPEILKYLHEEAKCPLSGSNRSYWLKNNNRECIEYIRSKDSNLLIKE